MRDVAYHLVLALDRETRRAVERDLLRRYGEDLAAHGGPSLDDDVVWRTYRRMAAGPFVAATFTVGLAGLRRAAAAIVDLGTAAALGLDPADIPSSGDG